MKKIKNFEDFDRHSFNEDGLYTFDLKSQPSFKDIKF